MRRAIPLPIRPRPTKATFMGSDDLALYPINFAGHVLHYVASLQVVGEHVPGVGLDLQVVGKRRLLVERQRLLQREARRAERPEVVEEYRHVKVGAPLTRPWVLLEVLEGVLEVH